MHKWNLHALTAVGTLALYLIAHWPVPGKTVSWMLCNQWWLRPRQYTEKNGRGYIVQQVMHRIQWWMCAIQCCDGSTSTTTANRWLPKRRCYRLSGVVQQHQQHWQAARWASTSEQTTTTTREAERGRQQRAGAVGCWSGTAEAVVPLYLRQALFSGVTHPPLPAFLNGHSIAELEPELLLLGDV